VCIPYVPVKKRAEVLNATEKHFPIDFLVIFRLIFALCIVLMDVVKNYRMIIVECICSFKMNWLVLQSCCSSHLE